MGVGTKGYNPTIASVDVMIILLISPFFFLKTIAHHAFNGKSSNRSQFKGKVSIMFLASRMLAGKKKRFMKINFSGTPIQLSKIVRGTLTLI